MSESTEPKKFAHVPILDGVRGLAILMVLIFHSVLVSPLGSIHQAYNRISSSLWIGVDLFFVLSGFLITSILLKAKGSEGFFRIFYARRALRIFPLYYLFVAFSIFVVPQIEYFRPWGIPNAIDDQWWYWLYGSNIFSAIQGKLPHPFLGPTWSLAIEEQFYLVWPVVVALFSLRWITVVSVGLIVLPAVLRPVLLAYGVWPNSIYVFTLTRIDPIATGAFIACLMQLKIPTAILRKAAYGVLSVSLLTMTFFVYEGLVNKKLTVMIHFGYTTVALLFGSFVVLCATSRPQGFFYHIMTHPFLLTAGKYSYGIYLFNRPMVPLIEKSIFNPKTFVLWGSHLPGQIFFTCLLISASFVLAFISWHLYERWFLALKKYF